MFLSEATIYQEALEKSEYKFKLKFDPQAKLPSKKKRCRKRDPTYFNPPYASNVRTNIGARFLKLIDKHFPLSNPLSKLINRNTIKMSYRCTPNLARIISGQNAKILSERIPKTEVRKCSCPKK